MQAYFGNFGIVRFCVLIQFLLWFVLPAMGQIDSLITWKTYTVADGYITRTMKPDDFQLYPRDSSDSAVVELAGHISGFESIKIVCERTHFGRKSIVYSEWIATVAGNFSTYVKIAAGLHEYNFYYQLPGAVAPKFKKIAGNVVCGDVYVISGQSNADTWDLTGEEINYLNTNYGPGYYVSSPPNLYSQFCRSFDIGLPGEGMPYWSVSAVAHYGYKHVGAWGKIIQFELVKRYKVPVLLINGAVGGTDITNNHLPAPGEYFFNPATYSICPPGAEPNPPVYRLFSRLNTNIYLVGAEKHVKGIFWLQGDSGDYDHVHGYIYEFKKMYDLWMKFFPGFKTFVVQVHSWFEYEEGMRMISEQQRNLPDSIPDLFVMSANGIGFHRPEKGHEIHFMAKGYENLAYRVLRLVEKVQYGKTELDVTAPNVIAAARSGSTVRLYFDQEISTLHSDNLANVMEMIKFDTGFNIKSHPVIVKNKVFFSIADTLVSTVSYAGFIPAQVVNGISHFDPDFQGYLRNRNDVAALSFHKIKVQHYDTLASYENFISPDLPLQVKIPVEYKIYPNPFSDSLHVEALETIEEISVTNIFGVVVLRDAPLTCHARFDLGEFPGGIYFISITTATGHKILRVVKL